MNRPSSTALLSLSFLLALGLSTLLTSSAVAQKCFDEKKNPIECPPGEKDRKAQKPTAVPPTATPEPTATLTPKPTETKTPVPAASEVAIAAVPVPPPPPNPNSPDCPPSPIALIAGMALFGAGALGSYLSRPRSGTPGGSWLAWRGVQGEGALGASYRTAGGAAGGQSPGDQQDGSDARGSDDGFAYQHSGAQQVLVNTAFGTASGRPNDRLGNAGPSSGGLGRTLSAMALFAGAGALAAMGIQSVGAVACSSTLPAALGAGLLGAAISLLLSRRSPRGGSLSLDANLDLVPPFEYHRDEVRATLNSGSTTTAVAKKSARTDDGVALPEGDLAFGRADPLRLGGTLEQDYEPGAGISLSGELKVVGDFQYNEDPVPATLNSGDIEPFNPDGSPTRPVVDLELPEPQAPPQPRTEASQDPAADSDANSADTDNADEKGD